MLDISSQTCSFTSDGILLYNSKRVFTTNIKYIKGAVYAKLQ